MPRVVWLLVSLFLLAPPAQALDLTGTWVSKKDGDMKCRYYSGGKWKRSVDGNLGTLYVRQVGATLYAEIVVGGSAVYNNKFQGLVRDAASGSERGVASATACEIVGENYHGAFWIPKASADASRGMMSVEFLGTNLSVVLHCKAKFERTSAADPGIAGTCP
jgi:hypothetical protein